MMDMTHYHAFGWLSDAERAEPYHAVPAPLAETGRDPGADDLATQILAATCDAVICLDHGGQIVFWNGAAERMFGVGAGRAIGARLDRILPPQPEDWCRSLYHALADEADMRRGSHLETNACRANGPAFSIDLTLVRWLGPAAGGGVAAILRDISERKAAERERHDAHALLANVFANLPGIVTVKDAETRKYLLINQAAEAMLGRPSEQIIGGTVCDIFPGEGDRFERRDNEALASLTPTIAKSACRQADGSVAQYRTRRSAVEGGTAHDRYILAVTEDITEVRRVEAQMLLDPLTGLINRDNSLERLGRLLAAHVPLALLKVDLDRFKAVNTQFGHRLGDDVLVEAADRLRGLAGPADLVGRVGGDEFVMILLGNNPADRAETVARAVVNRLAEPIATPRMTVHSGACVGFALSSDAGTLDDLRGFAELALQRAKRNGRGCFCAFSPEMDAAVRQRQRLESDLRAALQAGEITLAYQPVLSVATRQVVSVEALARWTHPARGAVPPDIFITLAEECGLICELGEYLLRRACTDALAWPEHISVAVNLSPLQFQRGDLYATVRAVLADTGLSPKRLQLEVTEGLVIQDVDRTFDELERLRALGIQILMDDFGVGYSSLSYFERFPFDKVKIDRSFINGLGNSRAAKAIINAVIGLGEQLNMGVVAEGVETAEQSHFLAAAGCTHLQGYLFSRPVGAAAVKAMLMQSGWGITEVARAA